MRLDGKKEPSGMGFILETVYLVNHLLVLKNPMPLTSV